MTIRMRVLAHAIHDLHHAGHTIEDAAYCIGAVVGLEGMTVLTYYKTCRSVIFTDKLERNYNRDVYGKKDRSKSPLLLDKTQRSV